MSDYILPELIPNILARLPVKDVLRCTSVCKSWYSLITSPYFTSLHLNIPDRESRLLVKSFKTEKRSYDYCLRCDNQTFDEITEVDPPSHRNWVIVDCLHGLVCLHDVRDDTIVLWNPSLRKSLILPKPRVLSDPRVTYLHTIGFGFVAASNEYKILKYSYAFECSRSQAEIYQLSTGSWHDVNLDDSLDVQVKYQQAHLNGILHWSAYNLRQEDHICSVDLKNEKFRTLTVPSCLRRNEDEYFIPDTIKGSLCLINYTTNKSCKIWSMKEYGKADSWEELFNINLEQHDLRRFVYFRDNGEILFEKSCQSSGTHKLVSYECENNRVKNDGLLENFRLTSVYTYAESLICPK